MMRFEEAYEGWKESRFSQEEAARLLGVCARSFRRYVVRYESEGLEGLLDKRLNAASHLMAPVDEVLALTDLYQGCYRGWNVKHFYEHYCERAGGQRSYTWVKTNLQKAGLVKKGIGKGKHRKKRERAPLKGMLIHQDGSDHEWVPDIRWDLIVTMDDATSEIYSAFFVEEEGTLSSFQGVLEVIEQYGLFSSFYSDRGSHYWTTAEAGGKVDKEKLTQFGRGLHQLGIQMIAAYSPEARGRSERMFKTLQERLPKELALKGICQREEANRFLKEEFLENFNRHFRVTAAEEGSAFVPVLGHNIKDILCIQEERVVGKDNCVRYNTKILQIPASANRAHYVKVKIRVHEYVDGHLAIFHGPRCLGRYTPDGILYEEQAAVIAVAA